MTSLEWAKAFAQSSTKLALTVVALVVAAGGAAQATAIIPPIFTVTSASCPGGTVSNLAINNQTGIKLYTGTSCSAIIPSIGGSLVLSASGTGTGIIPVSSIPINVVFTPTFDGVGNIDYSFALDLNGSQNTPQLTGSVATGTQVNQSFIFDIGPNVTLSTWSVALTLSSFPPPVLPHGQQSPSPLGTLGVTVPPNSIDINAPASATPEPSSLLLFASAAGAMLLRRRKS